MIDELDAIHQFLQLPTPEAWLDAAVDNQFVLLVDHAHCEKKAASTALNLMFRYVDKPDLLKKMSQLAREELLHFEQVLELMQARGIVYQHLSPSRYAKGLRTEMRMEEPARLVDGLIIGAFIEARSCERFAALAEVIKDEDLSRYYRFLLKSESRHFLDYLELARAYAKENNEKSDEENSKEIEDRIKLFRGIENELIASVDEEFRFHSGTPA